MGRIKKVATERHTATLSPFVEDFVKQSVEVPLHQLPQKLASFPQHWPFPRGDLYHWIPLLDRFDHILELFNKEYELKDGPQTQPFERRLLQKGDAEEGMPYPAAGAESQELDGAYSEEGDRELVESIVHFTRVLHEHCGNRSLYASSGHISDLLNTTSLSLLRLSLKLALRLAQRYQVAKYKSSGQGTSMLMTNHYNFNLENLQKIAMPFPKPAAPIVGQALVTSGKGKEKASLASGFNPADLVVIAKEPQALLSKGDIGSVTVNYYDQSASAPAKVAAASLPSEASPNTPTPVRRTSALGPSRDRPSAGDRSASTNDVTTPSKSRDLDQTSNAPKVFNIPSPKVECTPAWALLREALPQIPPELQYDLLNRIRIAKALTSPDMPTQQLLEVRLLAIANLSYALSESKFQEKIGIPDSEEPRRFHLAQQLCDLLQPAASGQRSLSLETETTVLNTIEAILRSRHKMAEVVDALSITVNHGVLYYELRKVIATLHGEPHADPEHELRELEWREATFDLVHNLQVQQAQHRVGERLVSAGIMTILIEVLSLRTTRAIRFQERVLQFFASFMHNLSTAMTSFAADHGFDVIADLVQHLVQSAEQSVKTGNALPAEYKSRVVDYNIPFYLQTTLRQLFKFIVQMFDNNAGTHDRLLRNLVDTPQLLTSLKTVIQDEHTFGSNCWTGAVNILSSFIHNEPTSYQVVGEAGLPRALLEALVGEKLPEELPAEPVLTDEDLPGDVEFNEDGEADWPAVSGILPVEQTMLDIPAAFGAICLNENGMQLFQASKVLVRYFDIFVSPPHVKALTDDDMPGNSAAFGIGSAFDELARHQPRLKDQIVRIVFAMAKRVAALTRQIARHKANGAKLWRRKTPSEPDVDIDGGVRAIAGLGLTDSNPEVAHGRVGAAFAQDALAEDQQALRFVTACSKFLEGFCHTTGMCAAFCEMGGAETVMDLVTSPSHPVELPTFNVYKSLVNLLKLMSDVKPHLVLPSILRRLQQAEEGVGPLGESWKRPEGLFRSFVEISSAEAAGTSLIDDGTTVLKSLSHVQILSDLMAKVLAPPVYTSRHATQTNTLFATLNFTDIYLQLVDNLTRLRATCLWENLRLITNESQEFKDKTDPKTHSLRRLDANGRVEISSNAFSQDNAARTNEPPKEVTEEAFKIRNVKSLRFVLEETISSVSRFIRNLGQGLLSRRGTDPSVKQHALVVAERIAKSMIWELDYRRFTVEDETTEVRYLAALLGPIPTTMIKTSFGMGGEPKEALTLVMREFYYAGGFGKLNGLLKRFGDIIAQQPARDKRSTDTRLKAASYGLNAILDFYQQIVRHKTIIESSQTAAMKTGLDSSFKPGQFVVELRDAILPAVTQLWNSDAIETMGDVCVKRIIDIMRVTLKAEGEEEAYRSHDKKMRKVSHPTANFSLMNNQHEETLRRGGISQALAREAIYRCNNTVVTASEYARLRMLDPRAPRFQIPEGETVAAEQLQSQNTGMEPQSPADRSVDMSDAPSPTASWTRPEASSEAMSGPNPAGVTATAESVDDENDEDDDDDEDDEEETGRYSSLTGMLNNVTDRDLAALVGERAASNVLQIANRLAESENQGSSTAANQGSTTAASTDGAKMVPYVYVDDLEKKRKELQDSLLDRCLEVLSAVPGVTFELCDLIQAAVPKGSESAASPRAEIGTTLVSSLMSLQGDESGVKIAAYAHLVALILQDRDFFDSTLDELKEYLVNFVDWVKAGAEGKVEDAPWLEMLLLILERMLAEDEQPAEIGWTPPPADDPMKTMPEPELPEPVVSDEARTDLFNALVDVLPKIGKNTSLALSVSRVMVMLTRRREWAARLAEKQNLGRLFLMIRQLPGSSSDDKLRGCFMLILRHLIEDETVVRQIMTSEVRAYLESSRVVTRGVDSTAYTRALYHLVLRDPKMFVDVTKELVEVLRYNGRPEQAQVLALKKEKLAEPAQQSEAAPTGEAEGVKASVEGAAGEEQKPAEPKAPLVEGTDGVVSFLLRELSNWRDVEDTARPSTAAAEPPKPNGEAPASPDIDMTDDSTTPTPNGTPALPSPTPSSSEKPVFKPEEHANFIYRCFLLQCLSELMQSYNRSKIEFINFSRKPESQHTPSKPRAGTLNYLLNNLVPVGTLEHKDDIVHRKKIVTSHWATEVIAGLCTKTTEKKLRHSRGVETAAEEDADLAFVRKFVLEHALRSFKEATISTEPLDQRYARLLAMAELFNRLLNKSERDAVPSDPMHKQQVGKLMYEKGYITALTAAIAELDLNFPNAKRAVKYILNPLKQLTDLGVELSQSSDSSSSGPGTSTEEEELSSATSVSDEDEREQTPDLLRNTTLGMLESSADHDEESSDDDDEEDEEMYDDDVYDEMDEMDYDEGEPAEHGDVVSDEDEDPEMGQIEGMPGDVDMDVEIVVDREGDDDDDDDDEDEDDEDEEDFHEHLDEITGDDENASIADDIDGDEDDWEEDDGDDFGDAAGDGGSPHGGPLEHIAHVLGADASDEQDDNEPAHLVRVDMGDGPEDYFEDEMAPEEEDEDDEEIEYDQEVAYEPELEGLLHNLRRTTARIDAATRRIQGALDRTQVNVDAAEDEDDDQEIGWDFDAPPPPTIVRGGHHHHGGFRGAPPTFFDMRGEAHRREYREGLTMGSANAGVAYTGMRSHRATQSGSRGEEDGTNPLLQRGASTSYDREREDPADLVGRYSRIVSRLPNAGFPPIDLIQDLVAHVGAANGHGSTINVNLGDIGNLRTGLRNVFQIRGGPQNGAALIDIDPSRPWQEQMGGRFGDWTGRGGLGDSGSSGLTDETRAVHFMLAGTTVRWQEEARMIFGRLFQDKAQRIVNEILRALVPAAMKAKQEHDRAERERMIAEEKAREEERKKEEAERAEREAQEKKEREEREERERLEREEQARLQAEQQQEDQAPEGSMEGVEGAEGDTQAEASAGPAEPEAEPVEQVFTTIRGRQVNITSLGIDRDFLDAIPEDMREEVIMAQVQEQRTQAAQNGEPPTEINREFLEALPRDIQQELLRSEASDRRRRERAEAQRQAAQAGNAQPARHTQPEEMDNADFMAMLDPALRQAILMDADENTLAVLPAEAQAEARALIGDRLPARMAGGMPTGIIRRGDGLAVVDPNGARHAAAAREASHQRRPIAQMLDKAGVATLMRLMFVSLHHKAKSSLHSILSDVCKNTQNRAEVISILLSILQDGTADVGAVERSFAQLSLKAKQTAPPKTPQPLKRTPTGLLGTPTTELSPLNIVQHCLSTLRSLAEDNTKVPSFFLTEHETSAVKAKTPKKGKGRESKAAKYPLNALLALLDRKLLTDNTGVMQELASLLSQVTRPLTILLKRAKEPQQPEQHQTNEAEGQGQAPTGDVTMSDAPAEDAASASQPTAGATTSASDKENSAKQPDKKSKELTPPEVPEENIRLVVNILAARECPTRTFSDTLDVIKHLSAIPGAKEIFGKELVRKAQDLGLSVLEDLQELSKQINSAETSTDLQGLALANFSSAGSKQRMLLRVILALDHLFDPTRIPQSADTDNAVKDDVLAMLYNSDNFEKLWSNLSSCLEAIRARGNMVNVATILLPLIESLMVVCRNSTLREKPAPAAMTVASPNDTKASTPTPESHMESLFFRFTEDNRKILNELIRNNPKLMSGNLSILARNSKVLEFDNKRTYFSRKVHNRGEARVAHPSLQLSVRRDSVFLDSFKSLYFKTAEEIKYGKLNIRFIGEEGIDAGGVSREWFAAMARQMFNPDYVLFLPVASDRTTFHPNPTSGINEEHLLFFKFIGRVIGKALYENRVLDCHFSRAVYRRILGKTVSLKDLESLDLKYYESLTWMLEHDITDIIIETFSAEIDRFGVTETVDLIPDGRNIPVTNENKHEYVQLIVEHLLIKAVEKQLEEFLKGFHEIIPKDLVSIFNEQELELLISGLPEIDVDDWKNNTEYHNYQATSPQIQWFWRAVRSFDKEERAKLLQFVTGTSKVPLNGFKELEGMNGFAKFNIHRDYSSKEKLPSSHTCFNQLDLPEYESYEHLRQQLYTAITAGSEYFGFA